MQLLDGFMSKVELRDYLRRIESLVSAEKWDDAVSHCKHILTIYPKYLNVYSLLGKIYLETQRYPDAFDVLRRILTVVPDDYISHIGLSVIYEDNQKFFESVYHMEIASEIQPAYKIIQDELLRLYTLIDKTRTPHIELSKAGLIREHVQAGLFDQSYIEAARFLEKHPDRIDIAVIFAKICKQSGRLEEAIRVCQAIVRQLPYCLETNKMLVDLLIHTGTTQETEIINNKINEIDPYYCQIKPESYNREVQQTISNQIEPFII
jgi:tetratricopeptide (TPR) repeat protein